MAAILIKSLVDTDLGMREELFLGEVWRRAGNGKIITHSFSHIAVCTQKFDADLVGQRSYSSVSTNTLEVQRNSIVDILLDLEFAIITIGGVDGTLYLSRKLVSVVKTWIDVNADRLV